MNLAPIVYLMIIMCPEEHYCTVPETGGYGGREAEYTQYFPMDNWQSCIDATAKAQVRESDADPEQSIIMVCVGGKAVVDARGAK